MAIKMEKIEFSTSLHQAFQSFSLQNYQTDYLSSIKVLNRHFLITNLNKGHKKAIKVAYIRPLTNYMGTIF